MWTLRPLGRAQRTAAVAVAAMLVVAACGGVDGSEEASPTSSAASLTTAVATADSDPFAMLPIRPEVRLDPSATTDDGRCRTYESGSPPFTMVADLSDDLVAAGWTVSNRFDTGKLYDASASATATKGRLTIDVNAAGTGPSSASMTVCVSG